MSGVRSWPRHRVPPRDARRIKVAHIITGLGVGGAEMMLAKLVANIDRSQFESTVISLSQDRALAERIGQAGVEVTSLAIEPSFIEGRSAVHHVLGALRQSKPDLVQTWMYHADLIGGIASAVAGLPVVWNVQAGTLDGIRGRTRNIARVCAATSHMLPRGIVSCSRAAIDAHTQLGYAKKRFVFIPNGADVGLFKPDPISRANVRAELRVRDDTPVIGMVARLHPLKDHPNFFAAASQLVATHPHVRFVLAGAGLESANDEVTQLVRASRLDQHVILLGLQSNIPRILCALDIHTLSSFGEGFPNVLAEAMAAGVPCVVTDVGDSAFIVGDTGRCVPARDPEALANAWRSLIDLPRDQFEELRARARTRIAAEFSLTSSVARYQQLYESALN